MAALNRPSNDRGQSPVLYLLFAGRHSDPTHGVGSLVAAFTCPEEARAAFRLARLNLPNREGWAELSVVSAGGAAKRVSWFGPERPRTDRSLTSVLAVADRPSADVAPRRRRLLPGNRRK